LNYVGFSVRCWGCAPPSPRNFKRPRTASANASFAENRHLQRRKWENLSGPANPDSQLAQIQVTPLLQALSTTVEKRRAVELGIYLGIDCRRSSRPGASFVPGRTSVTASSILAAWSSR